MRVHEQYWECYGARKDVQPLQFRKPTIVVTIWIAKNELSRSL
jgi:hypothetical protein